VTHAVRRPPEVKGGDGDLFIIVASDGVWEFTESDEACRIVDKYTSATEACSQVMMAS
jgi:serine/threonine protein phosphatase PrpC